MKLVTILLTAMLMMQNILFAQTPPAAPSYPQIRGYASIVHPIFTVDKHGTSFNFDGNYTVGFPFGLNLLKSDKIGFSFEFTPIIRVENGTDKLSSLLFHPGLMFRFPHGFTYIQRMAFETNGRYGLTSVFNKVIINRPALKYFIAVPVPFRFGNDKPASAGIGFQLGVNF